MLNFSSKDFLRDFWDECGEEGNKTWRSRANAYRTLELLKDMSFKSPSDKRWVKQREKFDNVKHKRHSLKSHKNCFVCGKQADVRHHIIPIKNGGHNGKRNLVSLCRLCHAEIHPWLKNV